MEVLGKIGIDWKLLIGQMINFGLLLWLLNRFLYKPIIKRIEKDERELDQVNIQRAKLKREKEALSREKNKTIMEAKRRSREIIKEAEDIAEKIKRRAQEEATQEKKAVIKQIKSRLAQINSAAEHKD